MDQNNGDVNSPTRVWYQSFVDPEEQRPYIQRLNEHLASLADPHFSFEVHGISPPDRYLHPITEFRIAEQVIRNKPSHSRRYTYLSPPWQDRSQAAATREVASRH